MILELNTTRLTSYYYALVKLPQNQTQPKLSKTLFFSSEYCTGLELNTIRLTSYHYASVKPPPNQTQPKLSKTFFFRILYTQALN